MSKPVLGLILGAVLEIFAGLTALFSPEAAPKITSIIFYSSILKNMAESRKLFKQLDQKQEFKIIKQEKYCMNPEFLSRMFGFNQYCMKVNTEGLTQEDSFIQPHTGGNCLNWVTGHVVATRNLILDLLGEAPIWSDQESEVYKRGSKPIQTGDQTQTLDKILTDFNRSQKIIVEKLSKMSAEDLSKKVDEKETLAQKLYFLHFHETYHIGQIGLLRRIAGKEGAIR